MKKIVLSIYVFFALILVVSCGGGGGGGSSTTPSDSIPGSNSKGNNSFSAAETQFITNGQKHFAFGETATFSSHEAGSWSAQHGQISSDGAYIPPTGLDSIKSDAITFTSSTGATETVTISLSPFPKLENEKFQFDGTVQSYQVSNVKGAVAVAVFRNDTIVSGETDLAAVISTGKASKEFESQFNQKKEKLAKLMQEDPRYRCSVKRNQNDAVKYSKRQANPPSQKKSPKKSDAAIDSITQFYHDEGSAKGFKDFQLKYKGSKCLIYSEMNSASKQAYVNTESCKMIGDAFEVKNKYHPNETPIFDSVTSIFGNPWGIDKNGNKINNGGRDEEEQVVILLYNGGSLYGYFYWVDEEAKGFVDNSTGYVSNGAEIIYLNQAYSNSEIAILGTLAHEFQHLCDYNQKFILDGQFSSDGFFDVSFDEDGPTMFNEGKSVLAEELNGFGLLITKGEGIRGNDFIFQNIDIYRSTISTFSSSFLSWNSGSDYGKGYLFWRYIYDTYGEETLSQLAQQSKLPPQNIEAGLGKSFDEVMQEFVFALMQAESSTPVNKTIAIKSYDLATSYFDTNGRLIGKLSPLGFNSGFPNNQIKKTKAWEIRLHKILPQNENVNFTISNLKTESSFSIFSVPIDK